MSRSFKVALVQLNSSNRLDDNLALASQSVETAASRGADLVMTPENTVFMDHRSKKLLANIADESGTEALQTFQALAERHRIWLLVGSIAIRVAADKAANRSFLIGPDGAIKARYDKIHMFDVDLPGGESYRESKVYRAGAAAALADTPWGRLGLTVCYDLRFPYLYRLLAERGAHFIAVPSAFTKQTGDAHWHILLRARAIETGSYIFAPAQTGEHVAGRQTFGHSLIVDPWGHVLADAEEAPNVIVAEINPDAVDDARKRIPSLMHTREVKVES